MRWVAGAVAATAMMYGSVASGQPATAQAEILFRDGKRLMGEGNIAAACEAFEGSQAKAPAISTLLNLADCREKNQQYASAWAHFVEAARQARGGNEALLQTAESRAKALEPRLSYLTISVPDDARIAGLVITRDGLLVESFEWNRAMPIDGGTYRVEAKAPAHEAWAATVTVRNATDQQTVTVPRFPDPGAVAAATATVPPQAPPLAAQQDDVSPGMSGRRKLAIGFAGAGLVAGIGAGWLELASRSTYADAEDVVDIDEPRSRELTDRANRQRHFAIAAGASGVVLVGVAAYLWTTGRSPRARAVTIAPHVSPSRVGLALEGRF